MGTAVAVPERGIDQNSLWAALTPAGLRRCRSSFKTLLWSRFVERGSHPEPTHQQKIKKGHPIGQPFFILWRRARDSNPELGILPPRHAP